MTNQPPEGPSQEVVVYAGPGVELTLPLDRERETVWASQAQIEELFGLDQSGVSRHIRTGIAICKNCILLLQIDR
jgi:hypothetical protein